MNRTRSFLSAFLLLGLSARLMAADYSLVDPQLKLVKIDSDENESLLGLAGDGMGRIFAGGREGLFVYEPKPHGLYLARQELYRFPSNSWVYNISIRGNDLYVLTTSALYEFPDGAVKRDGLQPKRLLWGSPMAHVHQGLHGMSFGPDGEELAVIANGTRNDCGLAFDTQWNLFGNDNDHESMPKEYVPGRLLHITPGAYFNWPRGWMPEKQPWRFDMLETMTPTLGRDVPVGMCYYNDDFLPEKYRHCLYDARW